MDILIEELTSGLPDGRQVARMAIRLLVAALMGAIVGVQREQIGKPAGIKTHMLVALGAALMIVAPSEAGMNSDELSRIIQGLVTGIGFIGGGAILKLHEQREVEGLTTASGIWMTAAIGTAAGLGRVALAISATILTWVILSVMPLLEIRINRGSEKRKKPQQDAE